MESFFTTIISLLIFFILIIKFANFKLNSNNLQTKRKTNKKVRFADEFVINKLTADPPKSESLLLQQTVAVGEENVGSYDILDELVKEKEGLISEEDDSDDDWEGVERSDLYKLFLEAASFGKVDDNLRNVDHDVKMELYGLYKVATEGPCHEGQPIALKVAARAKWNAWQKLGNMNPDVAMEQYITLLSEKIPGWCQGNQNTVDKN